jgi:hypothetical protein
VALGGLYTRAGLDAAVSPAVTAELGGSRFVGVGDVFAPTAG